MIRFLHNLINSSTSSLLILGYLLITSYAVTGQTQSPSIRTGVTFQWSDTQSVNSDSATIESITVDGEVYNTFSVPSAYELTRLGPDGHGPNFVSENGNRLPINNPQNSSNANWNSVALDAFQDKNLNHYFTSNPNGRNVCNNFTNASSTDAQKQTITYNPPLPSNDDGILAVTERGGNNCFYIEVYGTPAAGGAVQKLGETFVRSSGNYTGGGFMPPINNDTDYWGSGRSNDNGQTIAIALFELSSVAPTGSKISRIEFVAASRDHGDGKFFILQKYAVDQSQIGCLDQVYNGDLNIDNDTPTGSTYTVVPGTGPDQGNLILNTNGTYTYTPVNGFVGEVSFDYLVCLPFPNTGVCDTATVTLTYVELPEQAEVDLNCNTDGTTDLVIISPLGAQFEYSLNGGNYQSSTTFENLAEGEYQLIVRDISTGCQNENSSTVSIENLEIALPVQVTDVSCTGEATGSIDLSVTGGLAPYFYDWSNGETTQDLTNVAAGVYTVVVTDSYGCTIEETITIDQPEFAISASAIAENANCAGEASGSIDLTPEGGTPPFDYLWSTGETTQDISGLSAGSYDVTITDDNGCTFTLNGTVVSEPTALSINISKIDATTAQGCEDGQATANVTGGTPPYTYQWGASAGNQTTQTAIGLDDSQPHPVIVTDANGCFITQSVVINCINTCDAVVVIDNVQNLQCNGDNSGAATVSASSVANTGATFTFTWSNGFVQAGVTSSTLQATGGGGVAAGVYTVGVTIDGTVCQAVEQTVSIAQPDVLSVSVSSTDETGPGLSNGTASATGVGGTPPYSYSWSNGETTAAISGLAPNDYTVTITDDNGCIAMNTVTINPGSCLNLSISATPTNVDCNGNSTGSATSTVTGGSDPINFAYQWSNGAITADITGVPAGSYTVTVFDSFTGCSDQATVQINEPSVLSGGAAASNVLCFGESTGSLNLAVNGGTFPYSFAWSNGATTEDIINLPAGTYNVTITDANGCTATASGTITQPASAVTVSITSTNENGETANDGTATATGAGGTSPYSYTWSNGETTDTITDLDSGTYTVTVTDGNGCQATETVTINSDNQVPLPQDDTETTPEDTPVNIDVTTNDDFGADGPSTGTIVIITQPLNGTATVNDNNTPNDPSDDSIDYVPGPNYNGTDTLEYQIEDSNGDTAFAKADITITPVQDAFDDTASTDEDVPVTIDILDNDLFSGDYPADYEVTEVTDPANGTVTINGDGTVTYTPDPNFNGTDTFDYTVTVNHPDGTTSTEVATVTVNILPKADVTDDVATTLEDVPVNVDILPNDDFSGVYGVDYETTSTTDPANGTVVIETDGSVTYIPNPDFNGTDTFDYTVTVNRADGTTETETATVVVTVRPVDANDDIDSTQEDTPVVVDVFGNDVLGDPGFGDTAAVTAVTDPANGTVTINGDGTVTYTPDADFNGTDTFDYTLVVTAPNGTTSTETATVIITVGAVDDVVDDVATTLEDVAVTIDVLANDGFDPTADVQITDTTAAANGTVSIVGNEVVYTPNPDFNGTDTFDYTVTVTNPDGTTTTETATVVVTVRPVDANDDIDSTQEDTPVVVDVFGNDVLGDPGFGDTAAVTAVTDPANGTVTINGDGTVTYTPDADFNGTDTFDYTLVVTAPNGTTSTETATVIITVGAVDDVVDDVATTLEDVAVTIDVLANDGFDPTADVQITDTTAAANGTVSIVGNEVVYTPNPDFNGTDTFDYTVTVTNPDGTTTTETATVVVTVRPVDANDDIDSTQEDTPVVVDVFGNDVLGDPGFGDTAAVTAVTDPANGTVTINGDGTVTYTPDADFNGTDTFDYTMVVTAPNGTTSTETATVIITVGAVDDVVDDVATTLEDVAVTIDVLANDGFDPTADVQITDTTAAANGTVSIVGNEVVYTPNPDFNGTDTFDYTVTVTNPDGTTTTETATVVVTVRPVDANDDIDSTQEDTPVVVDVFGNDVLGDSGFGDTAAVTAVTDPANGTVTINGDGTVTYTPDADFNGTDTFDYTLVVTAPNGTTSTETATVIITVGAVDDVVDDVATTLEDVAVTIDVLANDGFDPTADVQITDTTAAANGTVSIVGNEVVYTPNPDFNGTDTFDYTVTVTNPDGTTTTETATVVVTVRPVDANDDIDSTQEDTPVVVDVFGNDVLGDPGFGDTAAVTAVTDPANGTVTINGDGTVTYTPDADFNGTDTFDYTMVVTAPNGTTSTETATVIITVGAVDDVVDDVATTLEDVAVTIDVLANDGFDPTADVQITDTTAAANGTVSIVGNEVVYTPNPDFNGTDTFDYTVTVTNPDGTTTTETATVVVTVRPVDANDDIDSTQEDTPVVVDVFGNDVLGDPGFGDTAAVTAVTDPANGTVTINGDGTVTYTPDADFNGTDTFDYTMVVTAPNGTTSTETATVIITVGAVDDVVDDVATTLEDVAVTIDVLANDGFDPTADVQITDTTAAANGTVSIVGNEVVYTPNPDFNGTDTFDYTVTVTNPDGTTTTETATVVVTVRPVDANDDIDSTQEDTPVVVDVFGNDVLGDPGFGDTAAVTAVTDPANGTVTINGDGTVTYTPDADFNGTDTFDYTMVVTAPNGTTSTETATVIITVGAVDDVVDDVATTLEDVAVTIDVLANDGFDPTADVQITDTTAAANGTVSIVGNEVVYTPNPDFNGTDTFDYTVTVTNPDGTTTTETATVVVTVRPVDANDDIDSTQEDTPVVVDVFGNDVLGDPGFGDTAAVTAVTDPANGTVTINGDGTVTYTPDANYNGTDTFDYILVVTAPNGTTSSETATVFITIIADNPSIELLKDGEYIDSNGDGIVNVGDTIEYSFTVTNTGDVILTDITIADPLPGITVTGGPIDLVPGEIDTDTFGATYIITQDDINAGSVNNLATVSGEEPGNDPNDPSDDITDDSEDPTPVDPVDQDPNCPECTVTILEQTPSLELLKDGVYVDTNGDGITNVGDEIVYTFTVTNTGNVTITGITISDPLVNVVGGPIDLDPQMSDSTTFTATYEITQDDIDNGAVFNLATATGNDPNGDPVSDDSEDPTPVDPVDQDPNCPECTVTILEQTPSLELLKDGVYVDTNGDGITNVGDEIVYTFTVTNTGNVTITGITISDPLVNVVGGPIDLDPQMSDSTTFTATYEITQDDIDNGAVFNLATATGNDPNGDPVSDDSEDPTPVDPVDQDPNCPECTVTILEQTPSLELLKDGVYVDTNGDGITNVGDEIVYTFTVTNTGNVTITGITISDPLVNVVGGPIDLDPQMSDSTTFTATYEITQDDIDNGAVFNLATATGNDPNGDPVSDDSEDPTPVDPVDQDPNCPECTVTILEQTPSLELLKDGVYVDTNGDGITNVGDEIVYTFTVTNTGNVTITGITISDPLVNVVGGPIDLDPQMSDSTTFTATYEITQDDIDNGAVFNLATATGNDPNGDPVSDDSEDPTPVDPVDQDPNCPECTVTILEQTPSLELLKDGVYVDTNGDGITNVGDEIVYTFTVTNTGNVTITGITISDPLVNVVGGPIDLDPQMSDSTTFTATYEITQDDIDNGAVFNLATATGNDPNGDPVSDDSEDPTPVDPVDQDPNCPECTVTILEQTPSLELLKDGVYVDTNGDGITNVGDEIVYTFTVTNTGNVTITGITISDPLVNVVGGPIDLDPQMSDSTTFTATYEITQDDIDNGAVFNLATATGNDPNGDPVSDDSEDPTPVDPVDQDPNCPECTVTILEQTPSLELLKDGVYVDTNGDGITNVGDEIVYTFTVTNTGNVTITGITISDPLVNVVGGPIDLDPQMSDSTTFTATYEITQDDIDNGAVFNLATATGNDPNGDPVSDDSEDPTPVDPVDQDPNCPECTVTILEQTPSLELLKDGVYVDTNGDGITNVGDEIVYTFTVTNTGNVTITGITISDPLVNVVGGPIDLDPQMSDSTTFTATYEITQDDIDNGAVFNLATATGNDPNGDPVSDDSEDPTPVDPVDQDPNCPECTVTILEQTPSLELLKDGVYVDTNGDGITNVGDEIVYTFTVTNTGNVTITGITISDPLVNVVGGPIDLDPQMSDSTTFTATYEITQDDIDNGAVFNLATATGNDPNGDPVSDDSEDPTPVDPVDQDPNCPECTVTILEQTPSLELLKDGVYVDTNGDGITNVGDEIVYTFTVTNTGNVTITGITISDPLVNVVGGPIDLDPQMSDSTTFTATYEITQDDIDNGAVFNLATATGNDPNGDPVSDDSEDPTPVDPVDQDPNCPECTVTILEQTPSLELLKDGVYVDTNGDGITNVGDEIVYTFTVTNTGNVTITGITISDPLVNVVGGPIDLDPQMSDSTTFTATYEITQDDIDNGAVFNLATATGNDPNGDPVSDDSEDPTPVDPVDQDPNCPECTVTILEQTPSLELLKDGVYVDTNGDGITNVGDEIVYTFTVTNTGNVTITGITISDPLVNVVGGPIDLDPQMSDSTTFTATYEITQDDIDNGAVFNLATATGNDPNGDPVSDDSEDPTPVDPVDQDPNCPECTVTILEQTPSLELLKDGVYVDTNGDGITNVGDEIVYTFTVTNTGNVTITGITISDPLVNVVGGPIDLDPQMSDSTTFTATYEITQDDIDNGAVFNLATATGNDPNGDPVSDDSEDPTPVDPVDQDPNCPECTVTILEQTPSLELLKDGVYVDTNGDGITNVGDEIVYTFTVTNTGNVTITGITISDPLVNVVGGPIDLDPQMSDSTTFTATYEITQDDIDNGAVFNLATATGNDPNGDPVSDDSEDPTPVDPVDQDPNCPECTVTILEQTPSLELLKDGVYVDTNGDGITNVGDEIVYTFTVTNTGNVTITGITISDPLVNVVGGPIDLDPQMSDSTTFTATYEITQDDIDNGAVFNLATATGNDPNGDPVSDDSEDPTPVDPVDQDPNCPECTVTILEQTPSLELLKDGVYVDTNGDGITNVGDEIVYTFTVTNTGNVTITGITISDPLVNVVGGPIDLDPQMSDSTTFTATYEITQDDIDNGAVFNLATATGNDPNGDPVSDDSEDPTPVDPVDQDPNCPECTVTILEQSPSIALIKESTFVDQNGDGFAQAGETIVYNFTVTNTGNVTISNIVITDPLVTVTGGSIDLEPGESDTTTFSAIYTITQADVNAGFVENQALVTGQDPNGDDTTDISDDDSDLEDDITITDLPQEGMITLIKRGTFNDENGDGFAQVGESISYVFTVFNTGNVTINNITITDPLVDVVGGPISLEPNQGDSTTFSAEYFVTQEDIDTGFVENQALATGQDPDGNEVSDLSDEENALEDDPTITDLPNDNGQIAVIKNGLFNDENADGVAQVGETITYSFTVTNTGSVTISNIIITDPLVVVNGGPITLLPGEMDSTSFTATYTITQENIDDGFVENQATATGQNPDGNDVTDISDDDSNLEDDITITDLPFGASIALIKEGTFNDLNGDGFAQVGETITYAFTVTNTGSQTITNITIVDPLVPVTGGPIDLAPGETDSTTFTAVYTITDEDVLAGSVMNQAIATGQDPNGMDVSDMSDNDSPLEDDVTITDLPEDESSVSLEKTGEFVDLNGDGLAQEGELIMYSFTVTNTGQTVLTNIIVTDPLVTVEGGPIDLNPGESDSNTFTATYILTEEDIVQNLVVNQAVVTAFNGNNTIDDLSDDPNDPTDFDDNGDGEPDDPTITAFEGVLSESDITIYNGISDNGDGDNAIFVIEGIENFPENTVQIYNRWGVLLYERSGYKNDSEAFTGESDGRWTIRKGERLPVGTYYYIVNYVTEDGPRSQAGYLYINR